LLRGVSHLIKIRRIQRSVLRKAWVPLENKRGEATFVLLVIVNKDLGKSILYFL